MATAQNNLAFHPSRLFTAWLSQSRASLAFTTYQAGKLFLIGLQPDGRLAVSERNFERCMGLALDRDTLWLATLYQIWRFSNFLRVDERYEGHDAFYVPVASHVTGDIDVHDLHMDVNGQPIFAATRVNCIATLGQHHSFREIWRPHFIDRLAVEDRCHLNGLALRDGEPAYVTAVSQSNIADGWRDHRRDGGVVIDFASGDSVAAGLSMPHSPRMYRGRLYLLQAGTGEFGSLDPKNGCFAPLCFLPGFARGLAFLGNHAVIGVSRPRGDRAFHGLAVNDRLDREKSSAKCGLYVVNLSTGDIEHSLLIEGVVQELFDVATLPGLARPMALGLKSDQIRFMIRPETIL